MQTEEGEDTDFGWRRLLDRATQWSALGLPQCTEKLMTMWRATYSCHRRPSLIPPRCEILMWDNQSDRIPGR